MTVSRDDVRLLGFVVDMAYSAQTLHAKDRWEARLEVVDIEPAAVFTRIRDDGMWDLGLVATYFALAWRCGPDIVSRAADRVLGDNSRRARRFGNRGPVSR